jgi:hypothetical protein
VGLQMNIFMKSFLTKSETSAHFFRLPCSEENKYKDVNLLLASLETLSYCNSKDCSASCIRISVLGQFFHCTLFVIAGCRTVFGITGGFQTKFYNHRWLFESWDKLPKRVLGRISGIVHVFKEKSGNSTFSFPHIQATKTCESHQRSYRKNFFDFLDLQKIFIF